MDILVEELDGSLWAAAVEGGRLEGIEVDPAAEEVRWGSIYWAKVARIDTALDAAFVNLDGENIGILYNADVRIKSARGVKKGGDVAIGKVLHPGQMIAVQAKSGFLPSDPADPHSKAEHKSPRVSMDVALSGRYLIYTPLESENRVSQRVRDKKLRTQLKTMLDGMGKKSDCHGCILRAAAVGAQTDVLVREARIQKEAWTQIQEFFKGTKPTLIMMGPDAVQRMISDHAGRRIKRVDVTTMQHYQEVEEWCEVYAPDLVTKIKPVEVPDQDIELGLFAFHDIVGQIEDVLQPYAVMAKGGTIIIQETAALTAIDINSGADKRPPLAINTDAAAEVARQIRLRNLGGIIVVDFLKMKGKADQAKILKVLDEKFNDDACTVQIHGFTNLGLVEITRNRRTPPLQERFESVVSLRGDPS